MSHLGPSRRKLGHLVGALVGGEQIAGGVHRDVIGDPYVDWRVVRVAVGVVLDYRAPGVGDEEISGRVERETSWEAAH